MKVIQTWEKNKPNTTTGASITIKYIYQGTDEEIEELIEWCKQNIGYAKIMEVNADEDSD